MTPRAFPFYSEIAGAADRFRRLLPCARAVQQALLRDILRHNAATEAGRLQGFAHIDGHVAFRERVPVMDYEALLPCIERMAAGVPDVLVPGIPIAFEETGGSSAGPKLVPHTPRALDAFRYALLPWLDDLARAYPALAAGYAYWAISPAARAARTTGGGIAVGLGGDAAYFGAALAPLVIDTLAVPPSVGALTGIEAWRDATCAHLLQCEDLALISVWSPTFLDDLLAHMRAHAQRLTRGMAPARARAVCAELGADNPDYRRVWPQLQVVSCWDQAASRAHAAALRAQLGAIPVQGKGLLATEGVTSIPLHELPAPVLAVESAYFEFRDGTGTCHDIGGVVPGGEYELLLTTWGGLYRYAIGDRVRVTGFAGEAPLIEFLGRAGVASDLCGEKLTEDFVLRALQPLGLRFALLAPAVRRGYVLFVDAAEVTAQSDVIASAETALCANPQYAYARRLGQLAPLELRRCVAPLRTWLDEGRARGMRLGDIKPPALSPRGGWEARFQVVVS